MLRTRFDAAWKEALLHHLRWLLLLLFPRLAKAIDWRHDTLSLETELRQISPEGEVGTRYADALVRVRLLTGDQRVLHAEVQAKKDGEFERRAFVYAYRAYDFCLSWPETLVVYADEDRSWKPDQYLVKREYSSLRLKFTPVKLFASGAAARRSCGRWRTRWACSSWRTSSRAAPPATTASAPR